MTDKTTSAVPVQAGKHAIMAFLATFFDAPNDADITIRIGRAEAGGPSCVVVSMCGTVTAFLPEEADAIAGIAEDAMRQFAGEPEAKTLPNLIMGLRQGAVEARRQN